jgi:chromosome segregation ATPase
VDARRVFKRSARDDLEMEDESEVLVLEARLEELMAERDAAVQALERHQGDLGAELRLLTEEQDRFVSRLLANHESEIGRMRLELDEARITASRLEQKMERSRFSTTRLEEELGKARHGLERMREQRDIARAAAIAAEASATEAHIAVERLEGDLALAKSMLDDAMDGAESNEGEAIRLSFDTPPLLTPSEPVISGAVPRAGAIEESVPPRETLRRPRRRNTPTTLARRSETPRAVAINDAVRDSRPPRI